MWNINLRLWQAGSWSEKLRARAVNKNVQTVRDLTQNSWEARLPLLTGVADGASGKLASKKEGIAVSRKGIMVTAFGENPDGKGLILRLCEQAGISGIVTIKLGQGSKYTKASSVNLRVEVLDKTININANKLSFLSKVYAPASYILK